MKAGRKSIHAFKLLSKKEYEARCKKREQENMINGKKRAGRKSVYWHDYLEIGETCIFTGAGAINPHQTWSRSHADNKRFKATRLDGLVYVTRVEDKLMAKRVK